MIGVEVATFGLVAGDAIDLTTGWGASRRDHQREADRLLDQQQPFILIGSPPCTALSQLQSLRPDRENKEKALK